METLLTIHLNCIHQTLRWSDPNPLNMYTSKTYTHFNNNTLRAADNRTELGARDGVTANCQLRAEGERLWTTMLYQLREVWGGVCEGAVRRWTADQHCTQSASDNNSLSIELVTTDACYKALTREPWQQTTYSFPYSTKLNLILNLLKHCLVIFAHTTSGSRCI